MMKTLINFCWSLILGSVMQHLHAQSLPYQEITLSYRADTAGVEARQIITTRNRDFLVAGSYGRQGFIAKLNSCGSGLWLRQYLSGSHSTFEGIAELPSGNIAVVGQCTHCAPGDTTNKAYLGIFDAQGNLLRDTTFGRLNYGAKATAIIITREGKIALAGNFVWAGFLSPTDVFLTVLDENLHLDWWREYNEMYYDMANALAQKPDGGYVLTGYSALHILAPAQGQLFCVNTQGQLQWKHTSVHQPSVFNSVQATANGQVVALGWHQVDDSNRKKEVLLVSHAAANGALLQERWYGSTGYDDEGRSLHATDGGFLAGATYGAPAQTYWNRRDWILWLDANLSIVEQETFDSYLYAHNMINAVPLSQDRVDFAYLSKVHFFEDVQFRLYKRQRQGHHLLLTQAPQHYQLIPRHLPANRGTVTYTGMLLTPGAYEQVRLEVWRHNTLWHTAITNNPHQFALSVQIPAELAGYYFQLWGISGNTAYLEAEACDVVAGDTYVILGQSNAKAFPPILTPDSSSTYMDAFIRSFGKISNNHAAMRWRRDFSDDNPYVFDDYIGQWGRVLGRQLAREQGVPVAIINGGIGGISIDQMLPSATNRHDTARAYGRFYQRMAQAGLLQQVRALLFFQGETNALPSYNETVQSYQNKYLQLWQYWQLDYQPQRSYLFQIRPGCWQGNFHVIQEAQRRLPQLVPNLSVMSATGMNHDGCHYFFSNGYERAGLDIHRLVAKDLYGAPETPNIYPPQVDTIWFSDCNMTQVSLRLRHSADTYSWTPGWESDFRLEGAPQVQVLNGQITGHTVVLNLSQAPGIGFTGLSYLSHPLGAEAPVKNANGIGMLAFHNMPVGMCPVSTHEISKAQNHAQVSPNPTNGIFELQLPQPAQIALHNILGRQLMQGKYSAGNHTLQVEGPAGTYLLTIRTAQNEQTIRIIKS